MGKKNHEYSVEQIDKIISAFCDDSDNDDIVRADLEGFGVDVDKAKQSFNEFLDALENNSFK